jgi:hypothetical protein
LGKENDLTDEEKAQLSKFLISANEEMPEEPKSFAYSILQQASQKLTKKYIDVDFIPPGSVMVESLFSIVGHMFDKSRLSTSPVHLEEQVFLRMNNHLWNLKSMLFMSIPDEVEDLNK